MPLDGSLPLIKEETPDAFEDLIQHPPPDHPAPRQLDGTDSDWKYRGRTDSEHTETQPISAPTGLVAQKDEGFQKFYKAVVSPTHVRVTAGGRIVPNTRGSSSPTTKWIKDKIPGDGTFTSRPPSRDPLDPATYPVPQAFAPFPHMFPGFVPGMPPGFPPGAQPFPLMPWHMGLSIGGSFAMPPYSLGQIPAGKTIPPNLSKSDKQSDNGASGTPVAVRVSPPDQFDHARPFFYNGQWVMPPSAPFYPYGMPPAQGFPAPPMIAPLAAAHRFGMPPHMVHPQARKPDQTAPAQAPRASSPPLSNVPNANTPSNPPISSIRPSEITKKQIDVLRGSLRYLENQLQFNKHQIDEKGMEHQAQLVRQQIGQFEKTLESQISFEEAHYPRHERKEDMSGSTSSQDYTQPKSPAVAENETGHASHGTSGNSQDEAVNLRADRSKAIKEASALRQGNVNPTNPSSTFSTVKLVRDPLVEKKVVRKASSLPVTAALAPPFQPRADTATLAAKSTDSYLDSIASRVEGTRQLKGAGVDHKACATFSGHSSLISGDETGEIPGPYLVGKLPYGMNSKLAIDTDYIYPRGLTEDELRARHMFWGKTPHDLQKGLPKFDGKDFYPPSPSNDRHSEAASDSSISRHSHAVGMTGVEYSATRPRIEADPFQSIGLAGPRFTRNRSGPNTQSEFLPQSEPSTAGSVSSELQRPGSCATQVGRNYGEFRKAMGKPASSSVVSFSSLESPKTRSPSNELDEVGEDKGLIFKGRKYMNRNG